MSDGTQNENKDNSKMVQINGCFDLKKSCYQGGKGPKNPEPPSDSSSGEVKEK